MMLRKILYACSVMVFIGTSMATQSVAAASGKSGAARSTNHSATNHSATSDATTSGTAGSNAAPARAALPSSGEVMARAYTMPEGTPHQTVHYNMATGTGGIAAGPTPVGFDNPVYINEPPPSIVFPPGAGRLIADDLITVAVGGCGMSGYEFIVGRSANWCSFTGQACATDSDCSGSQTCVPRPDQGFTADFAMYDGCPSLGNTQIIPGTEGTITFADNGLFTVLVDFAGANVTTGSTVWLGIEFDKTGAGWVVGTPASTGFTENIYDHPNFNCFANFSGTALYAGYHAKVFCSPDPPFEREFLAYFNPELTGPLQGPNLGQWIVDDVTLIVDDCIMTSYEIASVGSAPYTLTAEIRTSCGPTSVVDGTQGVFQGSGGGPELARFSFPAGIPLPNGANYWVAWKYNNNTTSGIIAEEPTLGVTENLFGITNRCNGDGSVCASDASCDRLCSLAGTPCVSATDCPAGETCNPQTCNLGCALFFFGPPPAPHSGFNITIRCLGDAPTGACCDLTSVPAGGTPLCSEVTQIACTGNLARYNQGAKCPLTCSIDGAPCTLDTDCGQACSLAGTPCVDATECPVGETCDVQTCLDLGVSFTPACGTSACCTPPEYVGGEGCFELERAECLAIQDSDFNPAIWQRGLFCNQGSQDCVRWVCRFAQGACDQEQPFGSVGCNNPNCCDTICNQDSFCCEFQWDQQCADRVSQAGGCDLPATNDACFDPSPSAGAVFVDVSTNVCGNDGSPCTTNDDCIPGVCNLPRVLMNTDGAISTDDEVFCCTGDGGFGAVWAKFIAPETSILITTAMSTGTSDDSVIQVFRVLDNSSEQAACASLVPIGCDDDSGSPAGQAHLSLWDLSVGSTYYVMLAAKAGSASGVYSVEFEAPTPDPLPNPAPPSNNFCGTPTAITPGQSVPYDLTSASSDCPLELAPCLLVPGLPDPPNPTRMDNDVWFRFTALGSGVVTIDTCGVDAPSTPDTTMTIYRTDTCPPDPVDLLACSNDAGGACGLGSSATFSVISFDVFMVRVGGFDGSEPSGMLNASLVQPDCQQNLIPDTDEIACGAGNFCGGTCSVGGAGCGVDADCTSGTCDGAFAGSADCQNNGQGNTLPDECDISLGISQDCNDNGIPDECDVAGGASQDCNANGIPDECDGGCTSITIASSVPPNGETDARQPTSLDGTVVFGWDSAVLTFDGDAAAVTTGDLVVTSTSGVAPSVSAINIAGTDVTVTLSGPIPPGAWTTITYSPTGSSVCLGFLPGDVNNDHTAAPSDILAVIDALNGVAPRPVFATDADRSGVAGPEDILRVIDMLNGASALDIWLDVAIGASPCP